MIDLFSATWTGANTYELRTDARRFENWECNYSAKLGLGAAVDYALKLGLETIRVTITDLADKLRNQLSEIDGVTVQDIGKQQCGIVSFSVDGISASQIAKRMHAKNINVSVSTPASTLIDATQRQLPELVRASVHYYNDEDELTYFLDVLHETISQSNRYN